MKKIILSVVSLSCSYALMAQSTMIDTRTKISRLNDEYCTSHFRVADGTIMAVAGDITAQAHLNVLDWLEGKVAGLQVYHFRNNLKVPFIRGTQASIYVDEMPVDAGYLNTLPASDIAMIKVIRGPFVGSIGANHVIAVYSIRPEEIEE